jgi:hypothetical protein
VNTEGRTTGSGKGHHWFSELDIHAMSSLIVGGAAVLSFNSSRDLADACGFHDWLSWVWPVCLDAVAYTATRIWLSRTTDDPTRLYARRLALAGISLSLAANGLDLFLSVEKLAPVWGVVLLVGAIPPAMLAAVIHMLVMRRGLTAHRAKKPAAPKATAPAPKPAPKTTTPALPAAPEPAAALATVTQMSATAPDWLTPDMELAPAITRYLDGHPDAKPSEVQLHIGQHLGAKADTTRKTLGRIRAKTNGPRAVGEE